MLAGLLLKNNLKESFRNISEQQLLFLKDEVVKGIVTLLNTWAQQHDKRIHLPNGVIIPANTLSPEQIVEVVSKIKEQP